MMRLIYIQYRMIHSQHRPGDDEFRSLYTDEEQIRIEPKMSSRSQQSYGNDRVSLFFAILFVVIMGIAFFKAGQPVTHQITQQQVANQSAMSAEHPGAVAEERKPTMGSEEHDRTPKILWVLTTVEIQGLLMTQSMIAKHLIHMGKKSDFDVRVVNCFTAYDWLTPEMTDWVRRTKHKSKYIVAVIDLLRIALIIEHGGLMVKLPSKYIFSDQFTWLYDLLNQPLNKLIQQQAQQAVQYCNSDKDAEVVLFYGKGRGGERIYEDSVIYARKESRLLRETFTEMNELLLSGTWNYKYMVNIQYMDQNVQVKYISNIFIELINFKQFYWFTGPTFCQNYQVLSINKNAGEFILKVESQETLRSQLTIDKKVFFEKYGKKRMVEGDFNGLNYNFQQMIQREQFGIAHKNSIFRTELLEIDGNQWMMKPINKTRDVRYCIISLKPLPQNYQLLLSQSTGRLNQQSYKQWHAVYFVKNLKQSHIDISPKVRLVNNSQYEGLNLQRAAITHCQLNEVGVILENDEQFGHQHDLRNIEVEMRNRSVYGAYLSFKYSGNIYKARFGQQTIRRKQMEPNVPLLKQIAHNFRVFSIYSYRFIPHMSLHDNYGRYYARQLVFLTLLEMAWDYRRCDEGEMLYHTKRVEQVMQIPKFRIVIPNTFIIMPIMREIDIAQQEYISKYSARTLCAAMKLYLDRKGRDMRHFFILNNGIEFVGFQDRKNYPQLLDKKIHQLWVGKQIPKYKKFLTQKVKQKHPDFQYFFWTEENITRENFPQSYDLITTLIDFTKESRYNKLSMVSDLMRSEIIYNHGGIYLDINYYVFNQNALNDWLTFKGMFASQLYPFQRFQREGGVFAAMKGFPRLKRLVDHRAISTRNHYSKEAHIELGPTFFASTVLGQEELDPEILQPPFEYLYPQYPWDDSSYKSLCEVDGNTKEQDLLFKNKLAYRKDCGDKYLWALGTDFWSEGKTWG